MGHTGSVHKPILSGNLRWGQGALLFWILLCFWNVAGARQMRRSAISVHLWNWIIIKQKQSFGNCCCEVGRWDLATVPSLLYMPFHVTDMAWMIFPRCHSNKTFACALYNHHLANCFHEVGTWGNFDYGMSASTIKVTSHSILHRVGAICISCQWRYKYIGILPWTCILQVFV